MLPPIVAGDRASRTYRCDTSRPFSFCVEIDQRRSCYAREVIAYAPNVLLFALLGGLVPTFLWLWFWLREDRSCPEPRTLILISFLAGIIAVPLVIPLERAVATVTSGTLMVVLWAMIEESMKFLVAYIAVLRHKEMNEPVDAVIYMITVALGFAAFENTLFLLEPLSLQLVADSLQIGNLRFIGATLLHTLASGTIGICIALTFYRGHYARDIAAVLGIILATLLHALFNFSIMTFNGRNEGILSVFLGLWLGIIVLILLFEKIKKIPNPFSLRISNLQQ